MSLLTLERSSPSPHESENDCEDVLSTSSYEGFVARDHFAMSLSPRPYTSLGPGRSGDSLRIFAHLKKLVKLLRSEDKLKMAVELESSSARKVTKYLVIVITNGYMDTEETVVLGTEQEGSTVRVCLVLPLWRDTEIKLDGDGGFSVHTGDRHQVFKPSSVQSMWAVLQVMYKATKDAQANNYYVGGLSHTWMSCYNVLVTTDGSILNEWNLLDDVESFRPDSPVYGSDVGNKGQERAALEKILITKLREMMVHSNLEVVTSKQLRIQLELQVNMELKDYRGFLDQQMLRILGQMERPSQIFDYLFLGSEWNASNLPELKELGVKYILNISREIDNFYPEEFKYLNIRLYDLPNSELMKHWDKTYTFLKEAKACGKKALVHCKMGISRSAATVVAYTMKEYKMSLNDALKHVKGKRSVVNPNDGFLSQLQAYEGILKARHNEMWGKKAPSRPIPVRAIGLYRARSQSEPNIPDLFHNAKNLEEEDEPELSFLEERGGDVPLLVTSSHLDGSKLLTPGTSHLSHTQSLVRLHPHSTPIDKTENIRQFLASLPNVTTVEDDPGFGDNMCTSESGSGYSSPISTPTDDDHLPSRYNKLAKEIKRESRAVSEQKRSVKEEGEGEGEREKGGEERKEDGGEQEACVVVRETETLSLEMSVECSFVPVKLPPPNDTQSNTVSSSNQADARDNETNHTSLSDRLQPIAQIPIFQGIPKPLRSTSLPRNILPQYYLEKPDLPRPDPSGSPDRLSESVLAEHGSTNLSVSESNFEMLSPSEQSSQQTLVKSEVPSTSGLVELPQIQSVPERIKEIEEMNSQKGLSKSPTVPVLSSGGGGGSQPTEKREKCEFFIPDETIPTAGSNRGSTSMTRTFSGHSLASSLASLGEAEEELKQLNLLNDNGNSNDGKSLHMVPARHASLSPPHLTPSPVVLSAESDTHVRTASCSLYPSEHLNDDPTSVATSLPLPSGPDAAGNRPLIRGAVKARVLDIERSKDERCASTDELAVRRPSPPFQQRAASSAAAFTVIPDAVMSSSDARDLKQLILAQQRRPSSEIVQESLSPGSHQRRETTPPAFLSAWSKLVDEIPTMPVQDLKKKFEDSDAVSVGSSIGSARPHREVKRSKGSLRRSQSLRAVDSPGKIRHRFKGFKKLSVSSANRTGSP